MRTLLILAVVCAAGYVAWMLATPVVNNRMLQARMIELAENRAMKSIRSIESDVMSFAVDHDIPLQREDIRVERRFDRTCIAARYRTTVRLPGGYEKDYEFYPSSDPEVRMDPFPSPRRLSRRQRR